MGISIFAVIEYDDNMTSEPFSTPPDGVIPLDDFWGLRESKDQLFLRVVLGWMEGGSSVIRRGLPTSASSQAATLMEQADPWEGWLNWLTLSELRDSLLASKLDPAEWSLGAQLVLEIMESLAKTVGADRVRLIVGIT